MNTRIITVFNLLLFTSYIAMGKTYYLSNNGDDKDNGSRQNPWRSLEKLNASMHLIQPGDSVLFERGGIFFGSLVVRLSGSSQKPVYIGAYGTGEKPVISGSVQVKNWRPYKKNIWTATCTSCIEEPANLFVDEKYQPLGRFPDKGYLRASSSPSDSATIADAASNFQAGYWNNAEVVIRSKHWILDILRVVSLSNHTFRFSAPASYALQKETHYFIQNHLSTLTSAGEWFFDPEKKQIYLYLTADHPGNSNIEVSVNNTGLLIHHSRYVTIENLSFARHNSTGGKVENSNNIILKNNSIVFSGRNGLEVTACSAPCVENNIIADSNNNGVEWRDNKDGIFSLNHVIRSGMHAGRGSGGNGSYNAINILGNTREKRNLLEHNRIDSSGYLGIDFRTGHTSIRNNVITNFCLVKDDGAGIYTWGNTYGNNEIEGNIIIGRTSNVEILNTKKSYSNGIYIDDRSRNIRIMGNTVAHCPAAGIFIHNANHIDIAGNTLFGNGENLFNREKGQLLIRRDGLAPSKEWDINELTIERNRLIATRDDQYCIYLIGRNKEDMQHPGSFTGNQYVATRPSNVVAWDHVYDKLCHAPDELTLEAWQAQMNEDDDSSVSTISPARTETSDNLIGNSTFTTGIEGWSIWPEQAALSQDQRAQMESASLKVAFTNDAWVFLYHRGFALDRNKLYRLSFSAMSTEEMKLEFVPMMATAPWKAIGDYTCFTILPERREYVYYFRPAEGSPEGRLNFKSDKTFWIDNIRLHEVDTRRMRNETSVRLFYNATSDARTIRLYQTLYTIDKKPAGNSIALPAYGSEILFVR